MPFIRSGELYENVILDSKFSDNSLPVAINEEFWELLAKEQRGIINNSQ